MPCAATISKSPRKAQRLSGFVCDAAQIRTGRAVDAHLSLASVYAQNVERIHLHRNRFQLHRLMLASQLMEAGSGRQSSWADTGGGTCSKGPRNWFRTASRCLAIERHGNFFGGPLAIAVVAVGRIGRSARRLRRSCRCGYRTERAGWRGRGPAEARRSPKDRAFPDGLLFESPRTAASCSRHRARSTLKAYRLR